MGVNPAALIELLDWPDSHGPIAVAARHSPPGTTVPTAWEAIVRSDDAQARCRFAFELWGEDFLELVPNFRTQLAHSLVDVRVCTTSARSILVYVFEPDPDRHVLWIGWDPATFGDNLPRFWDSIPAPVRRFLRETHAGFVSVDWETFGLMEPSEMITSAQKVDFSDEQAAAWDDTVHVVDYVSGAYKPMSCTRLLVIATRGWVLDYCISPDAPPGTLCFVDSSEIVVRDFGSTLDELLMRHLEGW
ncbi:hypothetical protein CCUG62472_03645 [Mycobacteroides salmoniphilum]|nr:hypothetical protein CCUG62472_03645 [Mycobacteroides salmoniphilum]